MRRTKVREALDEQIERSYYRQATGKTISAMDITAFYDEARQAVLAGKTVDEAVAEGVAKYCTAV